MHVCVPVRADGFILLNVCVHEGVSSLFRQQRYCVHVHACAAIGVCVCTSVCVCVSECICVRMCGTYAD